MAKRSSKNSPRISYWWWKCN